jgi:hypothetical protein
MHFIKNKHGMELGMYDTPLHERAIDGDVV